MGYPFEPDNVRPYAECFAAFKKSHMKVRNTHALRKLDQCMGSLMSLLAIPLLKAVMQIMQ